VAGWTGLEPATSDVTGRRSNQLNYHSAEVETWLGALGSSSIEAEDPFGFARKRDPVNQRGGATAYGVKSLDGGARYRLFCGSLHAA
jgi:hypothetical protein